MKRLRCPKCRSGDLVLTEISKVGMAFHQCADGWIRRVYGEDTPYWTHVEGLCSACGHEWRLRGRTQLGGLPNFHPETNPAPEPFNEADRLHHARLCGCGP